MPTVEETLQGIGTAAGWDARIAKIRLIPQDHGTAEHPRIYAAIARELYLSHLAPDFAYIHEAPFYESEYFETVYRDAARLTADFADVGEANLAAVLGQAPRTLLVFRTILGLTKEEFAHSTKLAAEPNNLRPLSAAKVDSMERSGTATTEDQGHIAAITISKIIDRSLFGAAPVGIRSKQAKVDTEDGWPSVRQCAADGVPYSHFLHQRHYGGAFRQVLDATSTKRGDIIEDAVEALFTTHRIPFLRTGSNNQAAIAHRFQIRVVPTPDFVAYDMSGTLRAMLECKGTNNGGTARDKALRFERLKAESLRLGGVPLIAVLGGIGWARVNDALGPVVRDTDGRVFTLQTLSEMLHVSPFPSLVGLQPQ